MADKAKNGYWVGFDLGGTKMLAAVLDGSFKPLVRKRKKTRGFEGEKAGLERIIETIRDALEEAKVDPSKLQGIGVGCPGPLDLDKGVILDAPNLGWTNVAVKATLEQEFKCPTVIANDVDAGVYGENQFGAAKNARCVVGVFPGTGIGGGCVYEGRIMRGKKSSCMEIGHIQVIPDGPRCGCGLRGCLEAVASRLAISAQAAQAAHRGQAEHLRAIIGTDLSDIRSGALAEAIAEGDEVVELIVRDASRHIGVALAGVVHLLSPDYVVLGGGLVEAMPKIIVQTVTATARDHVLPSFRDSFKVVAAELGDDATAMGAAAWAKASLSQKD
jgi:glucokinase